MLPLPALPPDARARMERNLDWSDARAYHFDVHQDAQQLIVIEEQAASADECAALCRIYRTHASLSAAKQASNVLTSPVLFLNHLRNNGELDAWRQCQRLKLRALQRARATFGLDELRVVVDDVDVQAIRAQAAQRVLTAPELDQLVSRNGKFARALFGALDENVTLADPRAWRMVAVLRREQQR